MTAIILAGGKSRRLGQDKAWLEIGGKPLIHRVLARLTPLFSELIVVAPRSNRLRGLKARVVPDILPDKGPLGGLYSGLKAASHKWAFCCACDMPFLNSRLIRALMAQTNTAGQDAIICQWEGRLQGLHGLYARSCLPVMQEALGQNQLKISEIFPALRVKYLGNEFIKTYDPEGSSFFNLNTREDLEQAVSNLNQSSPIPQG